VAAAAGRSGTWSPPAAARAGRQQPFPPCLVSPFVPAAESHRRTALVVPVGGPPPGAFAWPAAGGHPCPRSGLRGGGSRDRRKVALRDVLETRRRRPYHVLALKAEDGVDLIGVDWTRAGMRWTPTEDGGGGEADKGRTCRRAAAEEGYGGAASLGGWRRTGDAMGEGIEEVGGALSLSPSHRSDRRRTPK
jgi:hypothetical protein